MHFVKNTPESVTFKHKYIFSYKKQQILVFLSVLLSTILSLFFNSINAYSCESGQSN